MSTPTRVAEVPFGAANIHHEQPTIDTPRTLFSAAVVIATVVLSCVASRAIYTALLRQSNDRSRTPLYGDGLILPTEPRLEGIEMMSAAGTATSADNDNRLQTYGWTDRDKKIVRIPIQRAMELAVERGWLRGTIPATSNGPKRPDNSKTSDENKSAQ
jgi:hypothetical protein